MKGGGRRCWCWCRCAPIAPSLLPPLLSLSWDMSCHHHQQWYASLTELCTTAVLDNAALMLMLLMLPYLCLSLASTFLSNWCYFQCLHPHNGHYLSVFVCVTSLYLMKSINSYYFYWFSSPVCYCALMLVWLCITFHTAQWHILKGSWKTGNASRFDCRFAILADVQRSLGKMPFGACKHLTVLLHHTWSFIWFTLMFSRRCDYRCK